MPLKRQYSREPRYKYRAKNEAARLEEQISSLQVWIADHQDECDPELIELFWRKIEAERKLLEVESELIKF